MAEVEPEFIVRMPDGRKSKPTTKLRISEMHLTGKISDDAVVVRIGTVLETPVRVFLGLSSPKVESTSEGEQNERSGSGEESPESDSGFTPLQAKQFKFRSRNSIIDVVLSAFATVVSWPFRGFIIPTSGANQTRDYLRRTIVWLEFGLMLVHLASVVVFFLMAYVAVVALALGIRNLQQNGTRDLPQMLLAVVAAVQFYFFIFLWLMLFQSILRLVPASLRYWIETTEERRRLSKDSAAK